MRSNRAGVHTLYCGATAPYTLAFNVLLLLLRGVDAGAVLGMTRDAGWGSAAAAVMSHGGTVDGMVVNGVSVLLMKSALGGWIMTSHRLGHDAPPPGS